MPKRIVVGISGASGVTYGVRLLSVLKETDYETHLIISKSGELNIKIETDYDPADVKAMADYVYDHKNIAASLASGSFLTEGMVVVPCTIKTLSGIANSYNENLLVRAADVTLKEKRKLVLVVRETPLHKGHLRLMTMAADMGAHMMISSTKPSGRYLTTWASNTIFSSAGAMDQKTPISKVPP